MTGSTLQAPATTTALPRRKGSLPKWSPWALVAGSAVVAAGATALAGGFGIGLWVFLTVVVYLVATYVVSRAVEGARKAADRLVTAIVTGAFLLAMIPLVSVLWTVVSNGWARFDPTFFNSSMRGVVGVGGGALHAIQGTLIITALAAIMSIPVGVLTAIYLVEYGNRSRLARAITFFVDVMTGIPSIVAGLFAFALFALFVGPAVRFGFAGAVALTVLMIPIVVRSTEEMLKIVPNELREAAYALGVPKWRTILKVVIPTTAGGIATGVMLAVARVIGETAPLLVTTGLALGVNLNPFSGPMATLPVFSYYSYAVPGIPREAFLDRAWTAALVLMLVVMVLNIVARIISRIFAPKTR
ncbi:Phosphate transport system permease protein PstA [Pseudonocardia sp. Ae406_Ps2]|uniref:phosphate ABC transporter permease PstA n=1 Tax=unclassified Pseudonocardia TaxID=2619320 RepID=UPI0005BCF8EC|nr:MULTISPECIES: phosphate ABC transporter permease PstA [unclassified Pseudonocardia]OLL98971.1 Phosphate transport system permease protein PstA [Pseudonocardia sp. Ae331_Ps2]OLM03287.1 Phosphate transport system permease protein PstA [Pseudonocardia sp. Ae406_Ps2]OLM24851.1 Phosphate transport system permease protein PstA [Pseudonocardia sp. Ae706_Ps2]